MCFAIWWAERKCLFLKENNDENIIIVDLRGGDGGELHQLWQ